MRANHVKLLGFIQVTPKNCPAYPSRLYGTLHSDLRKKPLFNTKKIVRTYLSVEMPIFGISKQNTV